MQFKDNREGDCGICEACGEECQEVQIDQGFGPYEYGSIHDIHQDWVWVSPCCEAEVVPGGVKLVREKTHTARRDHKDGKIKVGDRYEVKVFRHWKEGGPSWITSSKRRLAS